MIELRTDLGILWFDGTVVEYFGVQDASLRYHVEYVSGAELKTDRKGRHTLTIKVNTSTPIGGDSIPPMKVAPEHVAVAEELAAQLNR